MEIRDQLVSSLRTATAALGDARAEIGRLADANTDLQTRNLDLTHKVADLEAALARGIDAEAAAGALKELDDAAGALRTVLPAKAPADAAPAGSAPTIV